MNILIVEDEPRLRDALVQIMVGQKYQVDAVASGTDALDYALAGDYDVIVLDVMIPGISGFDVVRMLRDEKKSTPVLMLTAHDEIPSRVKGLDSGADDYMTKPFAADELLARIRALSRRQGEVIIDELTFADLTLSLTNHTLYCGSKSVHLGFKEFEVLRLLMSNPAVITQKQELISKVWGALSDAEDNNVEAYISFLRKKLFFLGSKTAIETVRKVGYRLEAEGA